MAFARLIFIIGVGVTYSFVHGTVRVAVASCTRQIKIWLTIALWTEDSQLHSTYAGTHLDSECPLSGPCRRTEGNARNAGPVYCVDNCRKHRRSRVPIFGRLFRRNDSLSHDCCNYILKNNENIFNWTGWLLAGCFGLSDSLLQALVSFPSAGCHGKSLKKSSHSSQLKPFVLCVHSHRPCTMSILFTTPSSGKHRDAWPEHEQEPRTIMLEMA